MKKIMALIKDKSGETYIDLVVTVFVSILILAIIISVLPVFTTVQRMNYLVDETVRVAELKGSTDASVQADYNALKGVAGVNPKSISWSGTKYMGGTQKVQMNDKIQCTLKLDFELGNSFLGTYPVELVVTSSGRGEVYYK